MFNQEVIALLTHFTTAYLVGGSVRDAFLGHQPKDLDIEVFGVSFEELATLASAIGPTNAVGAAFGILKLQHPVLGEIDLSLPRRENKCGIGHKGFEVTPDQNLTIEEAAARRDFTFNALSWSPSSGLVDPFGGRADLEARILRHTSAAFAEDPLRVLRAFQFAGRMELTIAPETAELCRSLKEEYSTLPKERVWGEWEKWATKSIRPSAGLSVLKDTGWVDLYPELAAMQGVPQDAEWHPEGDVWVHTLLVCDAAADVCGREGITGTDRLVIVLAALCHDMAKPTHTQHEGGRIRSRGHEKAGEEPTRAFLASIGAPKAIVERVVPLVTNHLAHCSGEPNPKMVRRLATRLAPATVRELVLVIEADHSGRPPLPAGTPAAALQLLEVAESLNVEAAVPLQILQGRHLIEMGMKPGPLFKELLSRAFEAQLDGVFSDLEGGKAFVATLQN